MFVGSIYLAEFTSVRYEQYDEKVTMMTEEEALKMDREKRKVDMKEEYYVSLVLVTIIYRFLIFFFYFYF